jgi:hypothetical protein
VERAQKKAMWEEATCECRGWRRGPTRGAKASFFRMPARNVIPNLRTRMRPSWVGASRRETTMVAAPLGIGLLGFGFQTPAELEERAREYYRLVREEACRSARRSIPLWRC